MKKKLTVGLNFEDSVKMEWLKQQTKMSVSSLTSDIHARALYKLFRRLVVLGCFLFFVCFVLTQFL